MLGLDVHPEYPDSSLCLSALFRSITNLTNLSNQHWFPPLVAWFAIQQREMLQPSILKKSSLGRGLEDGIPNCSSFHGVGAVQVASDGSIYVSAGEGASWEGVDIGDRGDGCDLLFGFDQDTGARRAQQHQFLGRKGVENRFRIRLRTSR